MKPSIDLRTLTQQDMKFLNGVSEEYLAIQQRQLIRRYQNQPASLVDSERAAALELAVRSELPQNVAQMITDHVESSLAESQYSAANSYQQGERIGQAHSIDKSIAEGTRSISQDGQGLNLKQYHQARQTGEITYIDSGQRGRSWFRKVERIINDLARDYGLSPKQIEENLDNIVDLESRGDLKSLKKAARLATDSGVDTETIDEWKKHGARYEIEKRSQRRAQEEHKAGNQEIDQYTVKLDENSKRRLDIIAATAENNKNPFEDEPISENLLQDDGRTGDIARAMDVQEQNHNNAELEHSVSLAYNGIDPDDEFGDHDDD